MGEREDPWAAERHRPLPALVDVPGHLWRLLGRRGRIAVVLAAVCLAALAAAFVPGAVHTGKVDAVRARSARAAFVRARTRRLTFLERPHREALPASATRDARGAAARRVLERSVTAGMGLPTSCEINTALHRSRSYAAYACFAFARGGRGDGYDIEVGQRIRARVRVRATGSAGSAGSLVWCRDFPRPLHPDTQAYVTVPIPAACGQ
jgi:hypothetical protein